MIVYGDQVAMQIARRRIAIVRILRQATLDRLPEAARNAGRRGAERGRGLGHLFRQHVGRLLCLERQRPRERKEPDDAERVQVAAPVDGLA